MTTGFPSDSDLIPMFGFGIAGEGPARLADLRSIERDLRDASRLLERVAATDPEADGDLRRALYDSAAIAYRRGFTGGRSLLKKGTRTRVPDEVIDSLDSHDKVAHDAILEHVDKHVAHRVSDAEQWRVLLILDNPQVGRAVAGVACFGARFVGPTREDALRDAAIAAKLAEGVALAAEETQARIIAHAQERNLDELYAAAGPLDSDQSNVRGPSAAPG